MMGEPIYISFKVFEIFCNVSRLSISLSRFSVNILLLYNAKLLNCYNQQLQKSQVADGRTVKKVSSTRPIACESIDMATLHQRL